MKKTLLILFFIIVLIAASSQISRADDSTSPHIIQTPELFDHGTFHVDRYKSDLPVTGLGLVNGKLLASFSETEHAWFFQNTFKTVTGKNPAAALGYPSMQTAKSTITLPKKSPCEKFKDAIGALSLTETKTLCLSTTPGGDFTIRILPSTKDKPISIGFGKYPLLEKNRLTYVGYDGNIYVAWFHPNLFTDDITASKSKTSPTVFLTRNGMRYSVPDEKTFYTWFDSFKSVTSVDAKKLATTPLQSKAGYRSNTLIQFNDSPEIYVYQPPNNPFHVFGKDIKVVNETKDQWEIQIAKNKTTTILKKRVELLRHAASMTDLLNLYGQNWSTHLIKLDAAEKSKYTISEKDFDPTKDYVIE